MTSCENTATRGKKMSDSTRRINPSPHTPSCMTDKLNGREVFFTLQLPQSFSPAFSRKSFIGFNGDTKCPLQQHQQSG